MAPLAIVNTQPSFSEKATWFVKNWVAATSRAAWISSTSFLVLIVPLIVSMDREQGLVEADRQLDSALLEKAL